MMSQFDTYYKIIFYLPDGIQRPITVKSWSIDDRTGLLHWWDMDGKLSISNLYFEIEELERI